MNNSFLSKNLAAIKKSDPALFEKIAPLNGSTDYKVVISKSGLPSLIRIDAMGKKKQINSSYNPALEASRSLETLNIGESINFIVIGLGLGYQVLEIVRKSTSQAKIYIFEKDHELFALAIREVDFSRILEHPGVKIFIDINSLSLCSLLEPEQTNFTLNKYCLVRHKALVEEDLDYYGCLLSEIDKYFNEAEINLKTQSIHSKLYYKNIFSNLDIMLESPGIKLLENCLQDIPAIICSAGPSLDKNIQLLKSARSRFFLVSVATALKPLLYNGIHPDVVISIDPDEQTIKSFDFASDAENSWLVYNPAVPNVIPKAFPKRRLAFDSEVYLANWFKKHTEEKGNLGKVSSVAHSAVKLAQYFACSPIILVGQDLSFSKQRQHCLHSFYNEEHMDKVSRLNTLSYWDQMKFNSFGQNSTKTLDLFGEIITSTKAMESYSHIFSNYFEGSQNMVNATEGGMPIAGLQNLSLREAIHIYCNEVISVERNPFRIPPVIKVKPHNSLQDSMSKQIQVLKDMSEKLNTIELTHLKSKPLDSNAKTLFVKEMLNFYEKFLSNKETVFLLQGYDFAGFTNWYLSNSQILRKKDLSKPNSLLEEEFERDHKIFKVLQESAEYLIHNFEKAISQ
jgi:hypothetical protein